MKPRSRALGSFFCTDWKTLPRLHTNPRGLPWNGRCELNTCPFSMILLSNIAFHVCTMQRPNWIYYPFDFERPFLCSTASIPICCLSSPLSRPYLSQYWPPRPLLFSLSCFIVCVKQCCCPIVVFAFSFVDFFERPGRVPHWPHVNQQRGRRVLCFQHRKGHQKSLRNGICPSSE